MRKENPVAEETRPSVLVVDDDTRLRKLCTAFLQKGEYDVVAVEGADQALEEARVHRFDLVLTDMKMPGMPGDELIQLLKEIQPEILVVIMSGSPEANTMNESGAREIYQFIAKPFTMKDILEAVQKALRG